MPFGDPENRLFPGEKHIPLFTDKGFKMGQYIGPGTNLITRLVRGDQGISDVDRTAKRHDIDFTLAENPEDVRVADERMLSNLRKIRSRGSDYSINIENAYNAIRNKVFAEKVGLLSKGSFSGMKGKDLSTEDRRLLLENLRQLEQQGYGMIHKGRALYGSEIAHLMRKHPHFLGVYSKDEIAGLKLPKTGDWCFVYNLNDRDEPGSHWIAVNSNRDTPFIEHFDSFGVVPDKVVTEKLKNSKKPIKFSDNQLQKVDSVLCGFFCVEYLLARMKKSPEKVLASFTSKPSVYNEMKVIDDTI